MKCLLSDCKAGQAAKGHDLQYAGSFVFGDPDPQLQRMLISGLWQTP